MSIPYGKLDIKLNYCQNNPDGDACNITRNINWIGKIALMYPTDYAYTYAKGVDTECFNNPRICYFRESFSSAGEENPGVYNHPKMGWIFNSNINEEQNSIYFDLLSPTNNSWGSIFEISYNRYNSGSLEKRATSEKKGIRPVLYLKSSIQIIDGDGSEQNPYVLSSN